MPLKQLEKVLPWIINALNEEEADNLIQAICLAGTLSLSL
jgi:BRCT domain type II-containing protein